MRQFAGRSPSGRAIAQAGALLGPAAAIYGIFAVLPFLSVLRLSLERWDGLSTHRSFAGTANFRAIFHQDPVFWTAFNNSLIWTALAVIIPPSIGFALALGLDQKIRGRNTLRAIFYMPVIIAPIAVATIWRWMYDPFYGVFGSILNAVGLEDWQPDWLGDPKIALYSVFAAYAWQNVGFSMVLFLAGLQGVDNSLREAAKLDGARRFGVFRHVTLPAMRQTITIVVVLSLVNSFRTFDIVYGMTQGGPAQDTQIMALWAYWQSMQLHDFGKGSAIAVVLLVVTAIIVIPYLGWTRRREEAMS